MIGGTVIREGHPVSDRWRAAAEISHAVQTRRRSGLDTPRAAEAVINVCGRGVGQPRIVRSGHHHLAREWTESIVIERTEPRVCEVYGGPEEQHQGAYLIDGALARLHVASIAGGPADDLHTAGRGGLGLNRLLEMLGITMIGDGAVATVAHRRHSLFWATSGRFGDLMRWCASRPNLVRALGLSEIAVGFWLARRQWNQTDA